jgi:Spy/CpxP family protein refolding chaperone
MKTCISFIPAYRILVGLLAATFAGSGLSSLHAQTPSDPAIHAAHVASGAMPPDAPKNDAALAQQISQLQSKVAQLEATLAKSAPTIPVAPMAMGMDKMKPAAPMPGMGAGAAPPPQMPRMSSPAAPAAGPMGMMGMMDKMMGMMDKMMPMPGAAAPRPGVLPMPMDDKMEMAGMMGMGAMSGAGAIPQSTLPGFPGASHLYHIGATGFFLDHPQHIALTIEQQAGLNKVKEQALLAKSTAERAVEQAEQTLWTLTAADQPNAPQIEAKIREIEKLGGDARLSFIRAVGDASKLLTDEQRKILTGFAPPTPMNAMPAPAAAMPAGGMGDM